MFLNKLSVSILTSHEFFTFLGAIFQSIGYIGCMLIGNGVLTSVDYDNGLVKVPDVVQIDRT